MSVLVSGGFDPLHPGHIAYLHAAREFGDGHVVCAMASDAEVAQKHRLVLGQCDRGLLLLGTNLVDEVTYRPVAQALETIKPTHYVKGNDWEGQLPADQMETCARLGIQIVYTDTVTHSSSRLLQGPTIEDFERLVLSQKPAEKPWEPTAAVPYDFESRKKAEGKHPELIRDVLQPKTLLDYGCGYGHLVRMLRGLGVAAWGFEPYLSPTPEASDWVFGKRGTSYGIASGDWDVIVCREVAEHNTVLEIARLVRTLCCLEPRLIYLTSRFNCCPRSLWDVQTSDDLDPTHISLLPKDLLRSFFVLEGFKQRADLEAAMDWQGKNRCLVYERT